MKRTTVPRLKLRVPQAVVLESAAREVGRLAVELDDEVTVGPHGVDHEALKLDVGAGGNTSADAAGLCFLLIRCS